MRNTSDPYFKQNSQEPKHFRGGEKKVMKKSLSLLVAIAMVFSMFASVAAAATPELTTQQKFDALKEAGVFSGYPPNGDAGLNKEMTRAEFAKIVAIIAGYEDNAAGAAQYTDIPKNYWASPFIGAVTAEGIMNGLGAGKFGPTGKVTVEQVAKVVVELAGLEPEEGATVGGTSAWATGYVAAAIKAGFIPEQASYKGNALRSLLVEVAYDFGGDAAAVTVKSVKVVDDKNIEVTFSDNEVVKKALDTALVAGTATKVSVEYKGKTYEVEVKLDSIKATAAKQTGAKKITVDFNQPALAADKTDLTYELKSKFTTFAVTPKYADDNKSVVLEASYLPAGEYTLTVKGSEAIALKTEAEKASKVDITTPALQKANGIDLGAKLLNQFSEEMLAKPEVTAYNVTQKHNVTISGGKVNLLDDAVAKIDDVISVMAVYPSAGLSISKQLKVVNGSIATSIKLTEVAPLKDKSRISTNETGFVLPLSLTDANGQTVKLPQTTGNGMNLEGKASFFYAGLYFYISDLEIIKDFKVDSDGVIKFDTLAKSGTVIINVLNPVANVNASLTIVVNGPSAVKEFQVSDPGKYVVQGEEVVFPYVAIDNFGNKIEPKDVSLDKVEFGGANGVLKKLNAKGELVLTFPTKGSYTIYVYVNGVQQKDSLQVTVEDVAKTTAINSIKDVKTTLEVGAGVEFVEKNIQIVDNYGRSKDVATNTYGVTSDNTGVVKYENGKLVGVAAGSATVTVASTIQDVTSYKFTVNVVKSDDIKTYAINDIGTVYGKDSLTAGSDHAKVVELVGKTSSGVEVALVNKKAAFVSSSNSTILAVNTQESKIFGKKAGKATITVYNANNVKVAEQEVTVSEEVPAAKTAKFKKDEYSVTVGQTVVTEVEVKDQYGVKIAPTFSVTTKEKTIATNASNSFVVTGVKVGTTTLTYIDADGATATTTIVVNP